jgi:hypothetical protein
MKKSAKEKEEEDGEPAEAAQHSRTTLNEKARQIHSYMTFRAAKENLPHDLSVAYYRTFISQGINLIFGVTVGTNGLVSDVQQPRMFAEWKAQQGRPQ